MHWNFQIVRDACDVQDIAQLSARHQKLGNQVDAVVATASELLLDLLLRHLSLETLVQLLQITDPPNDPPPGSEKRTHLRSIHFCPKP